MKIKKIIPIVIISGLLIVLGVFLWKTKGLTDPLGSDRDWVRIEEFTQTNINGENVVENKKTKFKIRIPEDWISVGNWNLIFVSPDFKPHDNVGAYGPPIPKEGCSVSIEILKEIGFPADESTRFEYVEGLVEWCSEDEEECKKYGEEMIEVNGNKGMKYVNYQEEVSEVDHSVRIEFSKNESTYEISSYFYLRDRERCIQEFESILNTLEID